MNKWGWPSCCGEVVTIELPNHMRFNVDVATGVFTEAWRYQHAARPNAIISDSVGNSYVMMVGLTDSPVEWHAKVGAVTIDKLDANGALQWSLPVITFAEPIPQWGNIAGVAMMKTFGGQSEDTVYIAAVHRVVDATKSHGYVYPVYVHGFSTATGTPITPFLLYTIKHKDDFYPSTDPAVIRPPERDLIHCDRGHDGRLIVCTTGKLAQLDFLTGLDDHMSLVIATDTGVSAFAWANSLDMAFFSSHPFFGDDYTFRSLPVFDITTTANTIVCAGSSGVLRFEHDGSIESQHPHYDQAPSEKPPWGYIRQVSHLPTAKLIANSLDSHLWQLPEYDYPNNDWDDGLERLYGSMSTGHIAGSDRIVVGTKNGSTGNGYAEVWVYLADNLDQYGDPTKYAHLLNSEDWGLSGVKTGGIERLAGMVSIDPGSHSIHVIANSNGEPV